MTTDLERFGALLEGDFQTQVTDMAERLRWEWFHVFPAQVRDDGTKKRWITASSGSMRKGWPDLVLVRGSRIIFAELKRQSGKTDEEQDRVLELLAGVAEAYVWRPSNIDRIEELLK